MLPLAALAALGVSPGIYAWWSSRKLLSRLEDPLFPELYLAHSRRVGTAVGLAIGVGIALVRSHLLALLALVFVSVLVGGFSARRRIFEESWGLFSFLSHATRFWLAAIGYLLLIAAIPAVLSAVSDGAALPVGISLVVAAVVWAFAAPTAFRFFVRARPLDVPGVSAVFRPVVERARCEPALLFEADAPGGSWVNAFALPSVKRGAVLFTRGLLEALSVRETAAIFAHEVAHLEHFTRKKVALGVAATGVVAGLAVALWGGPYREALRGWEWIWPVVILVGLVARATKHRAHEGESDVRALELCRDPDALVSGLTKLHALNRVPRRWDGNFEKMSSHPSLARRIHAIRRAAAPGGPSLEREPFEELYRSADETRSAVVLDAERIHWLRGVPEDGEDLLLRAEERRSIRYADLTDLRLERRSERDFLTFTDTEGKTTRMPVSSGDIARLQALLDRQDHFVGYTAPVEEAPTGRFWSFLLLVLSITASFSFAGFVLAATALGFPGASTLVALGSGTVASAFVLALHPSTFGPTLGFTSALLTGALGITCFVLGVKRRRIEHEPVRRDVLFGTLVPLGVALASALGLIRVFLGGLPMMRLHSWASAHPSFLASVVALAAVLVALRRVKAYALAAPLLLLAGAFLFVGSNSFRHRFSEDSFARSGPSLPVLEAALEEIRAVSVPGAVYQIELSPKGMRFAASVIAAEREYSLASAASETFVEKEPGELVSMRAFAVAFADDERLLVLAPRDGRAVLELREIATGTVTPLASNLPLLGGAGIQTDGDRWRLVGTDWESEGVVVIGGTLGGGEPSVTRLDFEDWSGSLVAVNRAGWSLGPRYDVPDFSGWNASLLPYASWFLFSAGSSVVTEMHLTRPKEAPVVVGRSMLTVSCSSGPREMRFFCAASETGSTSLWAFEPETREWEPIGTLAGYFYPDERGADGLLVLNGSDQGPLVVSLEHERATRYLFPGDDPARWGILAARDDVVARAVSGGGENETAVTVYRVVR